MTVFVDLNASPADLRHTLYDGNLVVLTRVNAVSDLVDYPAGPRPRWAAL
jgi:hypothetical protein